MERRGFLKALGALTIAAAVPLRIEYDDAPVELLDQDSDAWAFVGEAGIYQISWMAAIRGATHATVRADLQRNGQSIGQAVRWFGVNEGVVGALCCFAICPAESGDMFDVTLRSDDRARFRVVDQSLLVHRVDYGMVGRQVT